MPSPRSNVPEKNGSKNIALVIHSIGRPGGVLRQSADSPLMWCKRWLVRYDTEPPVGPRWRLLRYRWAIITRTLTTIGADFEIDGRCQSLISICRGRRRLGHDLDGFKTHRRLDRHGRVSIDTVKFRLTRSNFDRTVHPIGHQSTVISNQ